MAGSSVQFFGKENVLKAYNTRAIDAWGLFDKKQFIHAGNGSEDLEAFLDMLTPGGSNAVYTLKVYRDLDADDITDRTECNGSFNFKLFAADQVQRSAVMAGPGNSTDPIMQKLQGVIMDEVGAAIDKRLNGADEEKEEDTWLGLIKGIVSDPEKLQGVLPIVHAIGSWLRPGAAAAAMQPAAVLAGPGKPVQHVGAAELATDDQKLQRLAAVLDRLEKNDPDILNVLEKIAHLQETDPAKYKMAKGFL